MNVSVRKSISKTVIALTTGLLCVGIVSGNEDNRTTVAEGTTNPFSGLEDRISAGKTEFNIHCSHCHGPNASQGEKRRDLRRLKRRYKEKMPDIFLSTAKNGRPKKGMPPWKDILAEEDLWQIYAFLETVQKE